MDKRIERSRDKPVGDMIMEVNKLMAEEYADSGKDSVHMDCTDITEENYEYMTH
jgi:hypothetical protein